MLIECGKEIQPRHSIQIVIDCMNKSRRGQDTHNKTQRIGTVVQLARGIFEDELCKRNGLRVDLVFDGVDESSVYMECLEVDPESRVFMDPCRWVVFHIVEQWVNEPLLVLGHITYN